MTAQAILYLVPLLPLFGAAINGVAGKKLPRAAVGAVACLGPLAALGLSVAFFLEASSATAAIRCAPLERFQLDWIQVGDLKLPLAFSLDRLAAVMLLVVTGVGSLIHIYALGYMAKDPGFARFFAYLNLFLSMMLVLVLGESLPLLFLGWEGVGLCSYLLIGFWHEDLKNSQAGKKAFIVNRVGDLGFAAGMFLAFTVYGTLELQGLNAAAAAGSAKGAAIPEWAKFWIPLLLFFGATGKSAQIPLFVWLPDAMAGPTPVSALIHAATMVTSGIYLLNRAAPLFSASPELLAIVAAVGALTALVAGFIALSQFDIKRVLAYSTVSQLGYMFLACGLGAFQLGMFHVVTHAFFKGLLFLGAGAVITSMGHEQDMRRMGGLRRKIPLTFALMATGALAIAGCPPFAGFFSKDAILTAAMAKALHGETQQGLFLSLWIVGVVTAVMTSFYSCRLMALTFFGKPRFAEEPGAGGGHGQGHAHGQESAHGGAVKESPAVMLLPMAALALLSVGGGFLDVPGFLGLRHDESAQAASDHHLGLVVGCGAFALGLAAAAFLFGKGAGLRARLVGGQPLGRALAALSSGKLFIDEIYDHLIVRPLRVCAELLFLLVDRALIDVALVGGGGLLARGMGGLLRQLQSGRLSSYAAWLVVGALILLLVAAAAAGG